MEKNNLLLAFIAVLFVALTVSYMYKTGRFDVQGMQGHDNWQQDNGWGPPPIQPDWINPGPPPQQAPPQMPPQRPPLLQKDPKSYQEAIQFAKQSNRNVLLFFTGNWCPHCKTMKTSTMSDPTVKQEMEKYIYYEVDTTRERSLAQKYNVSGIPAYRIVSPDERVLKSGQGRKSSSEFIRWLDSGQRQWLPFKR